MTIHRRDDRWGTGKEYLIPSTGEALPSVTSVLSGIDDGPILHKWIAKVCVEYAVSDLDQLRTRLAADRDATIRDMKQAADRARDEAGDRGTRIHKAAEQLVLGTNIKPVLRPDDLPYWYSFLRWYHEHAHMKWLSSETTIINRTFGYAGTLDAVIRLGGVTGIVDIKTGRTVRPTWALQQAAYAHGETILLRDGRELPFTPLTTGWVLWVRPEAEGGTLLVNVPVDANAFEAFLAAMDLYRFKNRIKDTVAQQTKQRQQAAKKGRADIKRRQRSLHSVA